VPGSHDRRGCRVADQCGVLHEPRGLTRPQRARRH
jgi:hypothetical protein